jgi:DNA-binding transcriptional regulator YbjK
MARARSPEKRSAILKAAVHEIAEVGLGAPTAKFLSRVCQVDIGRKARGRKSHPPEYLDRRERS